MNYLIGLNMLNFFMADVRDGLGPFLGVFLQQKGWHPGEIGFVMTLGGLAGMLATTPMGMLVDAIRAKRLVIVVAACAIIIASMTNYFFYSFTFTTASQIVCGIAAAVFAPAVAGITLGLVGQKGFAKQLGRNEAYNHGGNVTAALLSGVLGYYFGLGAVFVLMTAMAMGSMFAVSRIDPTAIDYDAARGLTTNNDLASSASPDLATGNLANGAATLTHQENDAEPKLKTATRQKKPGNPYRLRDLLKSPPLIALACTLLLFHLGNAAMLPILGQALVARGAGDASAFTSATIIVAQLTMIPIALLASRVAQKRGYWILFVIALAALPLRGLLAGTIDESWVLLPVQVLDGFGAGLLGVAVPGLVAQLLRGSGRINAGLGMVMTVQGIGGALSTTLAGYFAEHISYNAAFMVLAAVATSALALWLLASALLKTSGLKSPGSKSSISAADQ